MHEHDDFECFSFRCADTMCADDVTFELSRTLEDREHSDSEQLALANVEPWSPVNLAVNVLREIMGKLGIQCLQARFDGRKFRVDEVCVAAAALAEFLAVRVR